MEVADDILLPNCVNYQIGSTTAIEIHPGEEAQVLHKIDVETSIRAGVEAMTLAALGLLGNP